MIKVAGTHSGHPFGAFVGRQILLEAGENDFRALYFKPGFLVRNFK